MDWDMLHSILIPSLRASWIQNCYDQNPIGIFLRAIPFLSSKGNSVKVDWLIELYYLAGGSQEDTSRIFQGSKWYITCLCPFKVNLYALFPSGVYLSNSFNVCPLCIALAFKFGHDPFRSYARNSTLRVRTNLLLEAGRNQYYCIWLWMDGPSFKHPP